MAEIRSAVREVMPEIGASMVVRAVDVLCLQVQAASHPDKGAAIIDELRNELEAHLCDGGFMEWQGLHPCDVMLQIIRDIDQEHASRASLEGVDTSMWMLRVAGGWDRNGR